MPDAVLINGVGQADCSRAQAGVVCGRTRPAVVRARLGSRLKLRLVNPGSEALVRVSVDQHVLRLVEVDDTPVRPVHMHEVSLAPGQRVSVVLHLNQGGARDAFWVRARAAGGCMFNAREMEARAVLRYTDRWGRAWSARPPTSAPWPDRAGTLAPCLDIDQEHSVVPLETEPLGPVAARGRLDSMAGRFVDPVTGADFLGFGIGADGGDRVTYTNYINDPVLKQVMDGRTLNASHFASLTLDGAQGQTADILLNQRDRALTHPFHLHGRPFSIMARGTGNITLEELEGRELQSQPLRRDTIVMPNGTWALLRVPLDDPGVWPIHCHLGWHLANGKLGVIVVRPDVVRGFDQPKDWLGLCTGDPGEIGPAKRTLQKRTLQKRPIHDPPANHSAGDAEPVGYVPRAAVKNATADLPAVNGTPSGPQNVSGPGLPPSTSSSDAHDASAPNAGAMFAEFETPANMSFTPAAASAYDDIPADAAAAWAAPGAVGNVSVGGGATPLDSARRQGLLRSGAGVSEAAVNSSVNANATVSAAVSANASAPGNASEEVSAAAGTSEGSSPGHALAVPAASASSAEAHPTGRPTAKKTKSKGKDKDKDGSRGSGGKARPTQAQGAQGRGDRGPSAFEGPSGV